MNTRKPKLNYAEQIQHMKSKGIQFNIMSEQDALQFLTNSNYYFKLKAFAKNYDKWFTGEQQGKYKDLEFACLVELSTLDMELRYLIIEMCLDIEHYLKMDLLRDVNENAQEDGYELVQRFFQYYPWVKSDLEEKTQKSSCKDVIEKYIEDPAVWNIVEVISFGQFMQLYDLYYKIYPVKQNYRAYLGCVKFIRNAAAHNNCLLNSIKRPYSVGFEKSKKVTSEIAKIPNIKKSVSKRMFGNPVVHDFVALICAYDKIIKSIRVKQNRYQELNALINQRFIRHKDYFATNKAITETYDFAKIVVDNYLKSAYNDL